MKIWIKYNRKQLLVQSIVFVIIMFYCVILWHNDEAVLNLRHFFVSVHVTGDNTRCPGPTDESRGIEQHLDKGMYVSIKTPHECLILSLLGVLLLCISCLLPDPSHLSDLWMMSSHVMCICTFTPTIMVRSNPSLQQCIFVFHSNLCCNVMATIPFQV